jgi:hypothetical protein
MAEFPPRQSRRSELTSVEGLHIWIDDSCIGYSDLRSEMAQVSGGTNAELSMLSKTSCQSFTANE